jgi:hypothetical protein
MNPPRLNPTQEPAVVIDHLRVLRNDVYRHRVVRRLRGLLVGAWDVDVMHEADGSCCRRQPWPRTLRSLTDELCRTSGRSVLVIVDP